MSILSAFPGGSSGMEIANGNKVQVMAMEAIPEKSFIDVFTDEPSFQINDATTSSGFFNDIASVSIDTTKGLVCTCYKNSQTVYLYTKIVSVSTNGSVNITAKTLSFNIDTAIKDIQTMQIYKFSSSLYLVVLNNRDDISYAIIPLSLSGTSLTLGTPYIHKDTGYHDSGTRAYSYIMPLSSSRFICVYKYTYCIAMLYDVSGTTITPVVDSVRSGSTNYYRVNKLAILYDSNNSQVCLAGFNGPNSCLNYTVFTISGNTISSSDKRIELSSYFDWEYEDHGGVGYVSINTASGYYLLSDLTTTDGEVILYLAFSNGVLNCNIVGTSSVSPFDIGYVYAVNGSTKALIGMHLYDDDNQVLSNNVTTPLNNVSAVPKIGEYKFTTTFGERPVHSYGVPIGVYNNYALWASIYTPFGSENKFTCFIFKLTALIPGHAYNSAFTSKNIKNGISTDAIAKNNIGTVIVPK